MSRVEITLTPAQVAQVMRGAAPDTLADPFDAELGDRWLRDRLGPMLSGGRYSIVTVRAVLTLLTIPKHKDGVAVRRLAEQLGLAPSTTLRYVNTLSRAGFGGGFVAWIRPRGGRAFCDAKSKEVPTGVDRAGRSSGA